MHYANGFLLCPPFLCREDERTLTMSSVANYFSEKVAKRRLICCYMTL